MCAAPIDSNQRIPILSLDGEKKPESDIRDASERIEGVAPRLIFLSGTSTAGKSTMMRQYAKSEANTVELGTDDFAEKIRSVSLIKNCYEDEYLIFTQAVEDKDIYRFLFFTPRDLVESKPELFFKPDSSKSQREAAISLIYDSDFPLRCYNLLEAHKANQDKEHVEAILDHASKGVSVIFDTPNEDNFYKQLETFSEDHKLPHLIKVERFLIYVPLEELLNRLTERNAEAISSGNLSNQRLNIDLLNQFKSTYRRAKPGEVVIDILKREDIQKIVEEKRNEIDAENKDMRERGRAANAVEEEAYLEYFGLTSPGSEVGITTITNYEKFNGIFRTATQPTALSINQLSSYSWEKL